jgi:lambda repressor-like predicted transcriptional regulator
VGARSFTPAQEEKICEHYKAGESLNSLSRSYDAAPSTIQLALMRHSVSTRRPRGRKGSRSFTSIQKRELCQLYQAGESTPQLAKEYGVDSSTACDTLNRHGIRFRGNVLQLTEA